MGGLSVGFGLLIPSLRNETLVLDKSTYLWHQRTHKEMSYGMIRCIEGRCARKI